MPSNNNHTSESTPLLHSLLPPPPIHIHADGESGRRGFHPTRFLYVAWRSGSNAAKYTNLLWPFVLVAIVLHFAAPSHPIAVFSTSYVGMVPVANLLGFAGQEFARKMPKVAGILIETAFGSVVEIILFVVLISKHENAGKGSSSEHGNLIPVIQAAILGSILTNLLLCLGLCFFVGGLRQARQRFHAAVSEVGTGLLLVAGFGLLIPSAYYSALKGETVGGDSKHRDAFTDKVLQHNVLRISQVTSVLLILAFCIFIYYNARSQHSLFDDVLEADEHRDMDHHYDVTKPKFTLTECGIALAVSIAIVTLLAYFLVERIEEVVERGVPDQFLGLILLPLVEKAAEHLTAVDEAWDGQINFALFHCIGPSIQTALFNAPLVVLVAWCLGKPMDLNFEIFMCVLLVLSILVVGNFLRDGESNYLEGAMLIIVYVIVAVATWYYPNPDVATSN
ncbi:vacuolar H+/Ca2+ exchanger [Decorospora gaudefroyi]|uniref:Vacuolar H+/Ca2+ exchanger n=1 Tax=Decorospora gaudefroyi TaxID=184978 RepID=A0A6A5JZ61_9PLEO|nr:vacuolar H+/Ca2+ exchanger [Decorospora gaudefroyi]